MKRHLVRSRSDKSVVYKVDVYDTFAECNCPAFQFRKQCAHIKFILKKYYASNNNIGSDADVRSESDKPGV